jgi:hypothetical protein
VSLLFDLQDKFKKVRADVSSIREDVSDLLIDLNNWMNSGSKDVLPSMPEQEIENEDDDEPASPAMSDFEARQLVEAWIATYFIQE